MRGARRQPPRGGASAAPSWPAMTMEFNVKKASLLDNLKEGDAVRFELRQSQPNEWVIVKIERR